MGRSTVAQLITKGKAENGYNNAGINSDAQWVDFFNDALSDLVDDLGLQSTFNVAFDGSKRENDLPADFYSLFVFNDGDNYRVNARRNYDQVYPPGYWILNKGGKYIMDLYQYYNAQTFTGLYNRYAALLTPDTEGLAKTPEIPTVGEKALIYYAISKALRNNNQIGQAKDYESLFEAERLKIRNAASRARGA